MQRVILQVPMTRELKQKAEIASFDMGFSSLQEIVRVILNKLAKKELSMIITEAEEINDLSPAAERKFKKAIEDIKAGRNVTKTKNINELLSLLHS